MVEQQRVNSETAREKQMRRLRASGSKNTSLYIYRLNNIAKIEISYYRQTRMTK